MRRSKFTDSQIAFILKQAEEGTPIAEVCRKAGISEVTFYIYGRLWSSAARLPDARPLSSSG